MCQCSSLRARDFENNWASYLVKCSRGYCEYATHASETTVSAMSSSEFNGCGIADASSGSVFFVTEIWTTAEVIIAEKGFEQNWGWPTSLRARKHILRFMHLRHRQRELELKAQTLSEMWMQAQDVCFSSQRSGLPHNSSSQARNNGCAVPMQFLAHIHCES
jgi:hypothetical protein